MTQWIVCCRQCRIGTIRCRRANFQPVARFRGQPVGKTACHCGDWKAPPCPIVVGSGSPLRSSISNSGVPRGETPISPGPIDANQQPTISGARAPPRNAELADPAFTGAAPDVIGVPADHSTAAATNKWIGAARGGFHCGGRAGRGDVGAAHTGCAAGTVAGTRTGRAAAPIGSAT